MAPKSLSHLTRRWTTYSVLVLLTCIHSQYAFASETWTVIAVPDTQHYVDSASNVDDFVTQMTWIADNIDTRNIVFVTHLGDVVQHGDVTLEWDRAETAMSIIDGAVPYSVAIGDHDYNDEERRNSGADEFISRFGAARYAGQPWYGGSSPDQKSHYQMFSGGGRTFLHLNLEWESPGTASDPTTPLGWAKQVLDAHPRTPTIISTHSYLWDKAGQKGRTNGIEEDGGNANSGEQIWSQLIRNSPQVFMVLNGNFHKGSSQYDPDDPSAPSFDGEFHQVSYNLHGLPVYEMLSNYQDYPNGGDGWIRILEFEAGGGANGLDRIRVKTYSTTMDAYQTDSVSDFHFDVSFADRFGAIPDPFELLQETFVTGEDTYVWEKNASSNYGGSTTFKIDTSNGGPMQGLIRFDTAFDGSGAIPAEAEVLSAELHLRLTESGNGFALHRMIADWSESNATWNAMAGGIDADGTDAVATAEHVTFNFLSEGESAGYSIFDVTESIHAWMDGAPQHGWAILPLGSDQLSLGSFEGSSLRPRLVVDYVLSGVKRVRVATGEDTYIWKKEGQNNSNFGSSDRIRIDLSDGAPAPGDLRPMQGLIRFDIPFGSGPAEIPVNSEILSAQLRLRLTDSGHGFRMHRMLVDWNESSVTWDGMSGGISDDGIEAAADPDVLTEDFLTEPSSASYSVFDVTAAVQAWANGQENHGWAMIPLGNNKLIVESFQGTNLKPELVINYTAAKSITFTTGNDAYIWKKTSTSNYGAEDRIRIDSSDGATAGSGPQPLQGLVRFDIRFGNTGIPLGAEIVRATLRLRLTDSGSGIAIYRMLAAWDEQTVSWSSLGDGIDLGTDAVNDPELVTADYLEEFSSVGYHQFDVTASVQRWTNGHVNRGWALMPLGNDKLIIESFQGTNLRPELVVEYRDPETASH